MLKALLLAVSLTSLPLQAAPPSSTRAFLVQDADMALRVRWDMIDKETKEIFADFHMWDTSGIGLYSLVKLCLKSQSGVRVRLIAEGFDIGKDTLIDAPALVKILQDSCASADGQKLEIRFWNPFDRTDPSNFLKYSKLHRSHEKMLYLEAQQAAYEGDRNWQNVNFRRNPKLPNYSYISADAVVSGPVVQDIKAHLENVWQLSRAIDPKLVEPDENGLLPPLRYDQFAQEKYDAVLADFEKKRQEILASESKVIQAIDWAQGLQAVGPVQYIYVDPAGRLKDKDDAMNAKLVALLDSAEKEVFISTPFLRLPDFLFNEIAKLRARNIAVKFVTSSQHSHLIIPIYPFQYRDVEKLKKIGVDVVYAASSDDLHLKSIVVDQKRAYIGTHNLDMRSSYLDLESGFIFEDSAVAEALTDFIAPFEKEYKVRWNPLQIVLKAIVEPLMQIPFFKKQL